MVIGVAPPWDDEVSIELILNHRPTNYRVYLEFDEQVQAKRIELRLCLHSNSPLIFSGPLFCFIHQVHATKASPTYFYMSLLLSSLVFPVYYTPVLWSLLYLASR